MTDTFALITRSCALLRAAGPQTRERLRRSARLRHYHRGETIFLHQSRAQACHLVLEGWVKLYRIAPNGCEALLGILKHAAFLKVLGSYPAAKAP